MPNKTIFLNTINAFEETVGQTFIDRIDLEKRLQEAWKKDSTQGKVYYLEEYRNIFLDTLKVYADREISTAYRKNFAETPDLKKCLLKTDEALKTCAMSLIPELRNNEDVLSNMTFGESDPKKLKRSLSTLKTKYLTHKTAEDTASQRRPVAYAKFKETWEKGTSIRHIAEVVRNRETLNKMTLDEKIDYALAIDSYRKDKTHPLPLDSKAEQLLDEAIDEWKKEIGCARDISIDEFVAARYFQSAQKLNDEEWLSKGVDDAIAEYDKTTNSAKKEIEQYKKLDESAKEEKARRESTVEAPGVTDEGLEMVGDFFKVEELTQEIEEVPTQKANRYYEETVEKFNQEYSLRISKEVFRDSVGKVSNLMVKARQEKEKFLAKGSVVVIEKGEEKLYTSDEYFKDYIEERKKSHQDELERLQNERQKAEKERQAILDRVKNLPEYVDEETRKTLVEGGETAYEEKCAAIDREIERAKRTLEEDLEATKRGIVIEKDGNKVRQYSSSQYYETHETKKEQHAYREYQKMYSRCFKDACKHIREKSYLEGKNPDYSKVAKDADKLFKTAMHNRDIFEDSKNVEIIQKSNFGAFTVEQLAEFVMEDQGSWALNQSTEQAWTLQKTAAKKIYAKIREAEKERPDVKPADRIKSLLERKKVAFQKGEISRKELLDYMIAADAHMQKDYPTTRSRFFSGQYSKEKVAINLCREALGLEKNSSLRVAMNAEYTALAKKNTKDEIFSSLEKEVKAAPTFESQKKTHDSEHKVVQDKILAEKKASLAKLKELDREPITIPTLDERKVILFQEPRVKPVKAPLQIQQNLNLQGNRG